KSCSKSSRVRKRLWFASSSRALQARVVQPPLPIAPILSIHRKQAIVQAIGKEKSVPPPGSVARHEIFTQKRSTTASPEVLRRSSTPVPLLLLVGGEIRKGKGKEEVKRHTPPCLSRSWWCPKRVRACVCECVSVRRHFAIEREREKSW
uniref:Uncharacterized protein n=1 Tax=Anopheles quadriannulatus TaxID=34691 RepID=A0A182XRY2_ANOQN